MEYYFTLQKSIEAELEFLIDPATEQNLEKTRQQSFEYFKLIHKPKSFTNTPDSYIIQQETAFEQLCCVLEDNGTVRAKKLTTYEFFTRAHYCEKKYKQPTTQ